jgi:hypothetical protein
LSHAVFNLNYDLFELLSQNNLLKKRKWYNQKQFLFCFLVF